MTAPVPEEHDESPGLPTPPPDDHDSELPDESDGGSDPAAEENAESSLDQPSDGAE